MTIPIIPGPWDWVRQLGEAGRKVIEGKTRGEELGRKQADEDQQRAMLQSQFMMQMLNSGVGDPNAMLPQLQSSLGQAGVGGVTPQSIGSYGETIATEQKARKGKATLSTAESEGGIKNLPAEQQAARFKAMFPEIQSDAKNAASEAVIKMKHAPTEADLEALTDKAMKAFEQRRTKIGGEPMTDQDREYIRPHIASAVHDNYLNWFHEQTGRKAAENRYGATNQSDASRRLIAQFNKSSDALAKMRGDKSSMVWMQYIDQGGQPDEKMTKLFGPQIAEYKKHNAIITITGMALNNIISPEDAGQRIANLEGMNTGGGVPSGSSTNAVQSAYDMIKAGKGTIEQLKAVAPADVYEAVKAKLGAGVKKVTDTVSKAGHDMLTAGADSTKVKQRREKK